MNLDVTCIDQGPADLHDPKAVENVERFLGLIVQTMNVKDRYMVQSIDSKPYLERLVLDRESEHGSGTYLHILWQSDLDRDPHDHPFDFESTIVHGGYKETRYTTLCISPCHVGRVRVAGKWLCPACGLECDKVEVESVRWYTAGLRNTVSADQLHRLELTTVPTVTLVKRGPKIRAWGFQTPTGWMQAKDWIAKFKPDASTEVE